MVRLLIQLLLWLDDAPVAGQELAGPQVNFVRPVLNSLCLLLFVQFHLRIGDDLVLYFHYTECSLWQ